MVGEQEEAWGLEEGEGSQAKPCSEQMVILGGEGADKAKGQARDGFGGGIDLEGRSLEAAVSRIRFTYSSYSILCYTYQLNVVLL